MKCDSSFLSVAPLGDGTSFYLDTLRAILSQLVLIGHAASFFGVMTFIHPPNFPWIQSIAVIGFFWLSGFLICHSSLLRKQRSKDYYFFDFFISRFARIYAGYVPALLFVFLIDWVFIELYPENYRFYESFSFEIAIKNVVMMQKFPIDFLRVPMFGSASTWWTLGIEWWLYMFFGWAFLKEKKWQHPKIYWFVLLLLSIVPVNFAVRGTGSVGIGLSLTWFLACGFALAKDVICKRVPREVMLISCLGLAALSVTRYKISMDAFDFISSLYFGGALLLSICWMQGFGTKIDKTLRKIVHITAGYSFTLFLTHYSILSFIHSAKLMHGWPAFNVSFLISNLVAFLLAFYFEMRFASFASFLRRLKVNKNEWLKINRHGIN